jgi:hypothetical protein
MESWARNAVTRFLRSGSREVGTARRLPTSGGQQVKLVIGLSGSESTLPGISSVLFERNGFDIPSISSWGYFRRVGVPFPYELTDGSGPVMT